MRESRPAQAFLTSSIHPKSNPVPVVRNLPIPFLTRSRYRGQGLKGDHRIIRLYRFRFPGQVGGLIMPPSG